MKMGFWWKGLIYDKRNSWPKAKEKKQAHRLHNGAPHS